ncbi:MAG: polysaccharide biosynthesis/export family protein [Hyphomicrobiaceae bacterium]|nr:polysaccharide biosynthesis/export family protein [Hyphomicrobiaceae bacterium]
MLAALDEVGAPSFFRTFGAHRGPAPVLRIGVGDVLQVSVFESAAGGLFVPAEAGVRPGNFVSIPSQTVSRDGTISVPYAGAVPAAGRTVPELERDIEKRLASRAIEPQVVVTWAEQNATAVTVIGEGGSSKLKINVAGERVLDMISRAGSLRYPGYELFVTLQRRAQRATVYFPHLVNSPDENIFVQPGDTLYVFRQPQKFVAVGALGNALQTAGLTSLYTFDQERLSLNEALGRAGGLQDTRANTSQVFLYRNESREALTRIGVDLSKFPPNQSIVPTIYRSNFRDPSSFFFASKFQMRNKDVIYVANSDSTEVTKFATYVRTISSTISGVGTDIAATRDLIGGAKILSGSNVVVSP